MAVSMTGVGPPALFVANMSEVRRVDGAGTVLPFPGRSGVPPSPHGVLAVDLNSDYRMDLVFAGAGGLKIFQQKEDGTFGDVTAATKLDPGVLDADAFGVWAADIEMDGDLDLVLGPRQGQVSVLRNNGDGTFSTFDPFEGATDLRDFAWADLDADGDPDAALLRRPRRPSDLLERTRGTVPAAAQSGRTRGRRRPGRRRCEQRRIDRPAGDASGRDRPAHLGPGRRPFLGHGRDCPLAGARRR